LRLNRRQLLDELNPINPITPPKPRRMEFEHQIPSRARSDVPNPVNSASRMQQE